MREKREKSFIVTTDLECPSCKKRYKGTVNLEDPPQRIRNGAYLVPCAWCLKATAAPGFWAWLDAVAKQEL